jgi:LytR cell envelope-related transcriptional attenuator
VDHPLAQPADSFHPWRATALVASALAAAELVVLMVGGFALLGRSLTHHAGVQQAAAGTASPTANPHRIPRQTPAGSPKLTRSETSVLVLNGNGIAGAAAGAAARVRRFGYILGGVGNASHPNAGPSVVMYRPGYRAEGLRLGRDLHVRSVGPLDGLRTSDLMGAHLAFVVGS